MYPYGQLVFVVASGIEAVLYLALAVLALLRLGQRWSALALLGALASLVPTAWYLVAELVLSSEDGLMTSFQFFYGPEAAVAMQLLRVIGVALLVAAVLVGRSKPEEAPAEGPTGTTVRQLPGNIRWQ